MLFLIVFVLLIYFTREMLFQIIFFYFFIFFITNIRKNEYKLKKNDIFNNYIFKIIKRKMNINHIIIDDCVVSRYLDKGIQISKITLFKKLNKNITELDFNNLPKISLGKIADNLLLSKLSSGDIKFNELPLLFNINKT